MSPDTIAEPHFSIWQELPKTRNRTLTRRAVIWIGQTCNLRCYFCYFLDRIKNSAHPEHPFLSLEKLKKICHTLRYFYGCVAIDIQGGEPTIYPDILPLIRYCRDIGLIPTLITNAIVLADRERLQAFKDAGIYDFAVSLHGIGDAHDEAVCKKGAYEKVIRALENMAMLEVPFRFNCTMSGSVYHTAPEIARTAVRYGAKVVNLKNCNAFDDHVESDREQMKIASFSEMRPYLSEAIDILTAAGIEVNIRYLPFCVLEPRHRKHIYNFQQLSYDHHEWDFESWTWTGMTQQRSRDLPLTPPMRLGLAAWTMVAGWSSTRVSLGFRSGLFTATQRVVARIHQGVAGRAALYRMQARLRASAHLNYRKDERCVGCSCLEICDGLQSDYIRRFGFGEVQAIHDHPKTDDPLYYIRHQDKYLDLARLPEIEAAVKHRLHAARTA